MRTYIYACETKLSLSYIGVLCILLMFVPKEMYLVYHANRIPSNVQYEGHDRPARVDHLGRLNAVPFRA
jgi:hypothetical protein